MRQVDVTTPFGSIVINSNYSSVLMFNSRFSLYSLRPRRLPLLRRRECDVTGHDRVICTDLQHAVHDAQHCGEQSVQPNRLRHIHATVVHTSACWCHRPFRVGARLLHLRQRRRWFFNFFIFFFGNSLFKHLLSHSSLNLLAFAKCLRCKCDVTRSLTVWSSQQSASLRASKQSLSHRDFDGSWDSTRFSVFRWSLRVCDDSATCYPHRRTAHFVTLTATPGRLLKPPVKGFGWGGRKILCIWRVLKASNYEKLAFAARVARVNS